MIDMEKIKKYMIHSALLLSLAASPFYLCNCKSKREAEEKNRFLRVMDNFNHDAFFGCIQEGKAEIETLGDETQLSCDYKLSDGVKLFFYRRIEKGQDIMKQNGKNGRWEDSTFPSIEHLTILTIVCDGLEIHYRFGQNRGHLYSDCRVGLEAVQYFDRKCTLGEEHTVKTKLEKIIGMEVFDF